MRILLERNRLGGVADADIEPLLAGCDREALITELTDDVEGFAWLLFERESQCVLRDLLLDCLAHVRRGAEESICWNKAVESLMRSLEVVVREVMFEPALRVDEVREHRAAEKLVPQRLPETLDLAERLRMLRATADVLDAVALERLFELGPSTPHRVLPTVVGQHFLWLTVRRDAAFEGFHHQSGFLVVCDRVADDEAAVVVHEHAQVQPLLATLKKRKDVRLPQLIRCRALEPPWQMLALR
jgi:hypothetical protein